MRMSSGVTIAQCPLIFHFPKKWLCKGVGKNVFYKGHLVHSYPPICPLQEIIKDIYFKQAHKGRAKGFFP